MIIMYVGKSSQTQTSRYFGRLMRDGVIEKLLPSWDPREGVTRRGVVSYRIEMSQLKAYLLINAIGARDDSQNVGALDITRGLTTAIERQSITSQTD